MIDVARKSMVLVLGILLCLMLVAFGCNDSTDAVLDGQGTTLGDDGENPEDDEGMDGDDEGNDEDGDGIDP